MKKLWASIIFLWTLQLSAAPWADVTPEAYPDADAVIVDSTEDITYNPDGTSVSKEETAIKILTEKGRREERVQRFSYSKRYSAINGPFVSIMDTNGVRRVVDVSGTTREATDNSSTSANIYDPLDRVITCTIPDLKVGEVLFYTFTRTNFAARVQNQYALFTEMTWVLPILIKKVHVISPSSLPLKKEAIRHPLGNITASEKTLDDGSILHTWVATNSPQVFPEPDMPPLYTQVQSVRASTLSSWTELSKWYWDLCQPHLAKTTPAMTNKVEELGRNMRKIYDFVAQEVRYMGLTMEDKSPGYAPHDVDITFDNRYGVCRDKAGLLVALLRVAGFEAYPVLIQVGEKMDPDVPTPYFNHAIVAVVDEKDPKNYILMDPTDESSKDLLPSYLNGRSYLVARPEGEELRTTQIVSADANAVVAETTGQIQKGGSIILTSDLRFLGINDNAWRGSLLRRKESERRLFLEQTLAAGFPGAELLAFDIKPTRLADTTEELKFHLVVKVPDVEIEGEESDLLYPPLLSGVFGFPMRLLQGRTALEKRVFPLKVMSTAKISETLKLELWKTPKPPTFPEESKTEGKFTFLRSYDFTNNTLTICRDLAVNDLEFSPDEYQDLRENLVKLEKDLRKPIVIPRDPEKGASVHYLKEDYDIWLSSPTAWVMTNTVVKQVLTYKGKKSSAEITLPYHPSVAQVEVVSAVVSNKNGKVSAAGPREMNILDCGWASAAPRYAPSKKLVVNLPSVEIGSTLYLKTATTVTNSPLPFRSNWYFDSLGQPSDELKVTLNGKVLRHEKNLKVIASEPNRPAGPLWRDTLTVSKGDFAAFSKVIAPFLEVKPIDPIPYVGTNEVRAIRDWMARQIRVAGPSLYEMPLAEQVTDPEIILKERYASCFDYIRTLAALLKGAGYAAEIILAADDAGADLKLIERNQKIYPNIGVYAYPICRVRVGEATYYLGTENEYTPLETSALEGGSICPTWVGGSEVGGGIPPSSRTGASEVGGGTPSSSPSQTDILTVTLRPNGDADIDYEQRVTGAEVGSLRKDYAEILPEERSRLYQSLLGELAQSAEATGPLVTDTEGYPFKLSFKAYIPNFAVKAEDLLTLTLPPFARAPFSALESTPRENPLASSAADAAVEEVVVIFPEGYGEIEHIPEAFSYDSPRLVGSTTVDHTEDGRLRVTLRRETPRRRSEMYAADTAALFRERARRINCRANRQITVRKNRTK